MAHGLMPPTSSPFDAAIWKEVESKLRDRALGEILLCTDRFSDWLFEHCTVSQVVRLFAVSFDLRGHDEFDRLRDAITEQYRAFRIEQAKATGEWTKIWEHLCRHA